MPPSEPVFGRAQGTLSGVKHTGRFVWGVPRMRKLIASALAAILALITASAAGANSAPSYGQVAASINGEQVMLADAGILQGRVFVPIRSTCAILSCVVEYERGQVTVKTGTRALVIDSASGTARRFDRMVDFPVQRQDGKLLVPLRALVEGLGGRVFWLPERDIKLYVLTPWAMQESLVALSEAIAKSPSELEAVRHIARNKGWAWMAFMRSPDVSFVPENLEPHGIFFWGHNKDAFVAHVVDKTFSLDRSIYEDGRSPSVDILVHVDLSSVGNEVGWIGYLTRNSQGYTMPELDFYFDRYNVNLRIAVEVGQRPEISDPVRGYVPGPGEWLPLQP